MTKDELVASLEQLALALEDEIARTREYHRPFAEERGIPVESVCRTDGTYILMGPTLALAQVRVVLAQLATKEDV